MSEPSPDLLKAKIESHEEVCAERYDRINEKIAEVNDRVAEVKRLLAWAAITIFGMFVGVLTWSLQQQYAAQQANQAATTAQIQLLQQKLSEMRR